MLLPYRPTSLLMNFEVNMKKCYMIQKFMKMIICSHIKFQQ